MKRRCPRCGKDKPISEFSFKNKEKGTLASYCKVCSRLYNLEHFKKNRSYYIKKASIRKTKLRKIAYLKILEYLKSHPCVTCKEGDPLVLQFDHVRGKKSFDITTMIGTLSYDKIEEEIRKCQVLCANCHARKTWTGSMKSKLLTL